MLVTLYFILASILSCAPKADPLKHYLASTFFIMEGDIKRAEDELKKAIKADPFAIKPRLDLVEVYIKGGKSKTAKRLLEDTQKYLSRPKHYVAVSRIWRRLKEKGKGIEVLREGFRKFPGSRRLVFELFGALWVTRRDEAEEVLRKYIKTRPNDYLAHMFLARLLLAEGKRKEAKKELKKAFEIRFDPNVVLELGKMLEKDGELEEAKKLYLEALEENPDLHDVRERLIEILLTYKEFQGAVSHAEYILESTGGTMGARVRYIITLLRAERYKEAISQAISALEIAPESPRFSFFKGLALKYLKRYEEAGKAFGKISRTSPLYGEAQSQLANCIKEERGTEEAIGYLRSLTGEPFPEITETYAILLKEISIDRAIKVLENAIKRFGESESLLYSLASLLYDAGKFEESVEVARKILEKDPNNPDALNFIGYVWAERGVNLDKAEEYIKRALKYKPREGYIIDSLGWVLFMKGDLKGAIKHLEEAYKLSKGDALITEHLADALKRKAERDGDVGVMRKAIKLYEEALTKEDAKKRRIREKLGEARKWLDER